MHRTIEKLIQRYGTPMTLTQGEEISEIFAFLQESHSKSEGGAQLEMSVLGEVPKGVYVYIGPVTPQAEKGDTLTLGDKSYLVRRADLVMAGEHSAYCWGICVEKGGDVRWGT